VKYSKIVNNIVVNKLLNSIPN